MAPHLPSAPTNRVQPRVSVLGGDHIAQVREFTLAVLAETGIRVDSQPGQRLLTRAGARAGDGGRLLLPRELVHWALAAAPSSVEIFGRRGQPAFRLGQPSTPPSPRFGIGVTCLYYQDPMTDAVTPFTRAHLQAMARLGETLSSFDVVSTVGVPQDVHPRRADLWAALDMAANTTKPLVVLVADATRFPDVLDLLEHLVGDLSARPWVIPYFNPMTPLVINGGTVDKMQCASERGLPFIYSSYGMAGATTPITAAGSLVLLNAELLAGLTLAQLMREGTPVILGSLPAFFDMKGMGSFYDTHSYVVNLACAEMMAHYGLPHAGTSGSGIGWGPDPMAWGHQWMNHLTSCMGQVGLVPFVGDSLGSKVYSPAVAVLADEIIQEARRLANGFELDSSSVDLEDIKQSAASGTFLTSERTVRLCHEAYYESRIFPHLTLEAWQARGSPEATELLRTHTVQLLARLGPPADSQDLMERGERFISELKIPD